MLVSGLPDWKRPPPNRWMYRLFHRTPLPCLDLMNLSAGSSLWISGEITFIAKNMLKIGVNTFLLTSPFTSEQVDIFGQFKAWGCDAVEIALEDASHIDADIIKRALDEYGIACSSICAAMGPGRDLRGTPAEQEAAVEYITQAMELMAQIGCPVMAGPMYSTVGRAEQTPEDEYRRQWDTVVAHLRRLAVRADNL